MALSVQVQNFYIITVKNCEGSASRLTGSPAPVVQMLASVRLLVRGKGLSHSWETVQLELPVHIHPLLTRPQVGDLEQSRWTPCTQWACVTAEEPLIL